jgi:hypothetical protein
MAEHPRRGTPAAGVFGHVAAMRVASCAAWRAWFPCLRLIWDNTGAMHRVEPYAEDSGRLISRTTLEAEELIA